MKHPLPSVDVGRQWFERVWNQRDAIAAEELMAPDAFAELEGGHKIVGPKAFLEYQRQFLEAIPDIRLDVIDTVADDNNVCIHWKASGGHTGHGLNFVPTNASIQFQGVTWIKTADGKIVSGRDFWNLSALMQTLSSATPEDLC